MRGSPAESYQAASQLLEDLRSVPAFELGVEQYLLVINAFQNAYRADPDGAVSAECLLLVARLYREMAERFDPSYRDEALKSYFELLREFPGSSEAEKVKEAVVELGVVLPDDHAEGSRDARMAPVSASASTPAPKSRGKPVRLREIRYWTHPDYTRVIIELEDEVQYKYDRVPNPERLYFDFFGTLMDASFRRDDKIEVGDSLLKRVRIGQNTSTITRVVFDLVEKEPHYNVSWLSNPARLVVEVRSTAPPVLTKNTNVPPAVKEPEPKVLAKAASLNESLPVERDALAPPAVAVPPPVVREPLARFVPPRAPGGKQPRAQAVAALNPPAFRETNTPPKPLIETRPLPAVPKPVPPPSQHSSGQAAPALQAKVTPPAADLPPPKPASATSQGNRNLIRALGLKVGRVVIDAGHGGHDTGGIGPTGLQEKDLVLDVSLRLGKLIQEGLGSEVIYTRTEDSFVPLGERTQLANQSRADLFISVHANSFRNRNVRGVETYYLNFTTDPWAMAVASRENAASDRSIHELQDLVSKIALKEKIDESREFAAKIQQALHGGLSSQIKGLRNRGVRKAPLVVLIGAKMPSVLAEIGFLSNPGDEKLLKSSAFRQKVAEFIYEGISSYAETLSTVSVAQRQSAVP